MEIKFKFEASLYISVFFLNTICRCIVMFDPYPVLFLCFSEREKKSEGRKRWKGRTAGNNRYRQSEEWITWIEERELSFLSLGRNVCPCACVRMCVCGHWSVAVTVYHSPLFSKLHRTSCHVLTHKHSHRRRCACNMHAHMFTDTIQHVCKATMTPPRHRCSNSNMIAWYTSAPRVTQICTF